MIIVKLSRLISYFIAWSQPLLQYRCFGRVFFYLSSRKSFTSQLANLFCVPVLKPWNTHLSRVSNTGSWITFPFNIVISFPLWLLDWRLVRQAVILWVLKKRHVAYMCYREIVDLKLLRLSIQSIIKWFLKLGRFEINMTDSASREDILDCGRR